MSPLAMPPMPTPAPQSLYRMTLPAPVVSLLGAGAGVASVEDGLQFENKSLRLVCAGLRAQVAELTETVARLRAAAQGASV